MARTPGLSQTAGVFINDYCHLRGRLMRRTGFEKLACRGLCYKQDDIWILTSRADTRVVGSDLVPFTDVVGGMDGSPIRAREFCMMLARLQANAAKTNWHAKKEFYSVLIKQQVVIINLFDEEQGQFSEVSLAPEELSLLLRAP